MTLLIAMDMGPLGIIASDKAEVMIGEDGETSLIHETASKITPTPLGVITGAGRVEILEPVKSRVKSGGVQNTNQVLEAITKARSQFRLRYGSHPQVEASLASTSWIFDYTALLDDDQTAHRIAMFHPSWGIENFRTLGFGQANCVAPSNFSSEEAIELTETVQKRMRMPASGEDLTQALLDNVGLVVKTMSEVSSRAVSVSNVCDIAIVGAQLSEITDGVTMENWKSKFAFLQS